MSAVPAIDERLPRTNLGLVIFRKPFCRASLDSNLLFLLPVVLHYVNLIFHAEAMPEVFWLEILQIVSASREVKMNKEVKPPLA